MVETAEKVSHCYITSAYVGIQSFSAEYQARTSPQTNVHTSGAWRPLQCVPGSLIN